MSRAGIPPHVDAPSPPPPAPVSLADGAGVAAPGGLDQDQEIRAEALMAAARLLEPVLRDVSVTTFELNLNRIGDMWLTLAGRGAGFIRGGSRP